eukprot:362548-Chlamydomonas_euryale.AAC.2
MQGVRRVGRRGAKLHWWGKGIWRDCKHRHASTTGRTGPGPRTSPTCKGQGMHHTRTHTSLIVAAQECAAIWHASCECLLVSCACTVRAVMHAACRSRGMRTLCASVGEGRATCSWGTTPTLPVDAAACFNLEAAGVTVMAEAATGRCFGGALRLLPDASAMRFGFGAPAWPRQNRRYVGTSGWRRACERHADRMLREGRCFQGPCRHVCLFGEAT